MAQRMGKSSIAVLETTIAFITLELRLRATGLQGLEPKCVHGAVETGASSNARHTRVSCSAYCLELLV